MDANNITATKQDVVDEINKNPALYAAVYKDYQRMSRTLGKSNGFKVVLANVVLSFRQREILIRNGQMPTTPGGIILPN